MAKKTRKQIQLEQIRAAYFEYWRLQNNPKYQAFYDKWEKLGEKAASEKMVRDHEGNVKSWMSVQCKKFGLGFILIDPRRQIDWTTLNDTGKADPDILAAIYGPGTKHWKAVWETQQAQSREEYFKGPIIHFAVNLMFDKKVILEELSSKIDIYQKMRKIKKKRDFIAKWPLYAQTWDMRRRESFNKIAALMHTTKPTVISRFQKAFELIYDIPYDEVFAREAFKTVHKVALRRRCGTCTDKECLKNFALGKNWIPCPDVAPYLMQDQQEKRGWREKTASSKDPVTSGHLGLIR